jgi:hypothetical protein
MTKLLVVGGPANGRRVEISDNASGLIIPVSDPSGGFGEARYTRRHLAGRYVLAPEDWTNDQVMEALVDANADRLN